MPGGYIEIATYSASVGDRIRLVLTGDGKPRPVFWLKLSDDGSIYLGPRLLGVSERLHGMARRNESGDFFIITEEGKQVADDNIINDVHTSFHASGVVNAGPIRAYRDPLREPSAQQWLCMAAFRHPTHYPAIPREKVGLRDACVVYPIQEDSPLWCNVYVAPEDKAVPVRIENAGHQVNMMYEFEATSQMGKRIIQVILFHGPNGKWPEYTFIAFAARDKS